MRTFFLPNEAFRRLMAVCLSLFSLSPIVAQNVSRTLNDGWKFLKGECPAAADSAFNDNEWTDIHLPHTWNTDAYTVKDYYRGTGWYRRRLELPEEWRGKQDIPPISGDFTFFGGIYRDVWLTAVPDQHFRRDNLGSDGIFISTPQVSEAQATLHVRGEIQNDATEKANLELTHSLYRVETTLRDRRTQAVLDQSSHPAGFRWFRFDADQGFFLNGKPYKLRGICRHQDQKPVGVALTDEMHRRDFRLMKEMGANFSGFEKYLAGQHRDQPTHPMLVSEYGAGSDRRLHSLTPRAFDFSMEYQQLYLEHYLPVLEETPYVCGGTHWNFIDFSSAGRDESMPRINNKGLAYADRTPKDVYYYYQAAWRKDIPVLHIASRDWTRRAGIAQAGNSVTQPVKVYTNLREVELLMDGKSLGKKPVKNHTAVFDVPFTDGRHLLLAQGIPVRHGEVTIQSLPDPVHDALSIGFTALPACLKEAFARPEAELAVNVGSRCFFTSDESRLTWLPDQPYTPGSWGYRFDVPAGIYEVEFLFTDIFREQATAAYLLGRTSGVESRESSFDIVINGTTVETAFSPARQSGYFHAVRRKYNITNLWDKIEIRFNALSGNCFLNGVKVRKIE